MKIRNLILAAAAILAVAVSCKKEKPVLGVSLDPATLAFSADGGSLTVKATSSDTWTASVPAAAQEWLQVSPLSGSGEVTVTVTASANAGKPRAVTVNFTSGLFTEPLSITQEGKQKAGDGKTLATAFTASEAHEWVMQNLGDGEISSDKFFVKGVIHKMVSSSGVDQYFASNSYGNASFFISDDGSPSDNDFECFQVNYLGNRAWKTGDTDVKVGDQVVIYGFVTNFKGNTAETTGKGAAFLVTLNDKTVEPTIESKAEPKGSGTKEDPYNIAAAINAVQNLKYTSTSNYEKIENVYVKGVISNIKSVDTGEYGNAEYSIVDEGFTTVFGVYRGFYLGGERFTKADQIKVGDKVTVFGAICNMFGNTPQFTTGNYLYEINGQKMKEPETVTGTVSDAIKAADNDNVVVNDAIVAALSAQGFIATDGKSNVYVYLKANPSVKIGDKVKIQAKKTTYYDLPELIEPNVEVVSSDNEVPRTELKDISATLDEYSAQVAEYITVSGKLVKDGDYYNVEVSGASRKATPSSLHSSFKLDGLVGKIVEMTGYFNTIHSAKNLVQIVVTEVKEGNQDAAFLSVSNKDIKVKAAATSASFNIESNGSWTITSDNEAFVPAPASGEGNATVTVSFPANTEEVDKVANLTIVCGDKTVVVVITQLSVSAEPTDTVSAVIKAADDTNVEINEAIVAALSTKGCIVTDGKNNVYVYANAAPSVKIGDMVSVKGKKTTFYGLPEITGPTFTVVSSGNEVPRTELVDITANIDAFGTNPPGTADYIVVKGKLEKSGNYWKVTVPGATYYASPDYMISAIDPSALEGKDVKMYGYFNTIHSTNKYVKVIVTEIVPADDNVKYLSVNPESLQFAAAGGELSITVSANQAWTVSTQDQFLEVSPASGEGNGTIKVVCAENPAEQARTGSIVVNGADNSTVEIAVTQGAKLPEGAGEVTITAAALTDGVLTDQGFTLTFDKKNGSTAPTYNTSGKDLRLYAKGTLTVNGGGVTITKMVFNISSQGQKRLAPITADTGTIATQAAGDTEVVWTGSAGKVTLTVGDKANYGSDGADKAGQFDFTSVVITFE